MAWYVAAPRCYRIPLCLENCNRIRDGGYAEEACTWTGPLVGSYLGVFAGVLLTLAVQRLFRHQPFSTTDTALSPAPAQDLAYETVDGVARLRQNLRLKTLHNEGLIDRLVQAERERMPTASEVGCYRGAIERWERENR